MPGKSILPGLISTGFQTITLADSTAIGINSTLRDAGAQVLRFTVETENARYREDGTDPALTTGVLLPKDTLYEWFGYSSTSALMFQRTTGTCKIQVQSYKYKSSGARS
jgi:hypothetical protein